MKIKAVVFDIGQTLVYYPFPLNWAELYRPAFESIAEKRKLNITENEYAHIAKVLKKYNTRINPREIEVSSNTIFTEIIKGTSIPTEYLDLIKNDFYSFFRRDIRIYPDAEETLRRIKSKNILIGTFSDVAYGMDNSYALEDIKPLLKYIDMPFTSIDAGFRKPNGKGLKILADKMQVLTSQMIFVGDERKDTECAKNAGAVSVLINRDSEEKHFGQDYTVRELKELAAIIEDNTVGTEIHRICRGDML